MTPQIPANLALATSLLIYPLLFRLITPSKAPPSRSAQSREALSILHSTSISTLAATELLHQCDKWAPPPRASSSRVPTTTALVSSAGQDISIIRTRSATGNAISAWECGYLIQDSVILLILTARKSHRAELALAKRLNNWRVLVCHHVGIAAGLGLFHLRAIRGDEKGILIILMMFLMNVSYVFLPSRCPPSLLYIIQCIHTSPFSTPSPGV